MPLQNRVLPTGEIVAHPARGLFMGNRGRLHDDDRRLVRRRSSQRYWITCTLAFKDRRRTLMARGSYTELFFLDEAVALAAGHRPCAECRRTDFEEFRTAWATALGTPKPRAPEMDAVLAAARSDRRGTQITHRARLADLPDGVFVRTDATSPALWLARQLYPFDPGGYGPPSATDPKFDVTVLTPAPSVATLAAGYRPSIHPSARPPPESGSGRP